MNELVGQVDVNALVGQVDVDALVSQVDVGALIARVDLDSLLASVDLDALLDPHRHRRAAGPHRPGHPADQDRPEHAAGLGRPGGAARAPRPERAARQRWTWTSCSASVDINALVQRLDMDALVSNTELGSIIAQSTSGVASEALDVVRSQGVGMDNFIARLTNRVLRRDVAELPGRAAAADRGTARAPATDRRSWPTRRHRRPAASPVAANGTDREQPTRPDRSRSTSRATTPARSPAWRRSRSTRASRPRRSRSPPRSITWALHLVTAGEVDWAPQPWVTGLIFTRLAVHLLRVPVGGQRQDLRHGAARASGSCARTASSTTPRNAVLRTLALPLSFLTLGLGLRPDHHRAPPPRAARQDRRHRGGVLLGRAGRPPAVPRPPAGHRGAGEPRVSPRRSRVARRGAPSGHDAPIPCAPTLALAPPSLTTRPTMPLLSFDQLQKIVNVFSPDRRFAGLAAGDHAVAAVAAALADAAHLAAPGRRQRRGDPGRPCGEQPGRLRGEQAHPRTRTR